tara:strand:- start:43557 stop:44066 length:510 start_codon:yes stop_codon:yes gene_type:complete
MDSSLPPPAVIPWDDDEGYPDCVGQLCDECSGRTHAYTCSKAKKCEDCGCRVDRRDITHSTTCSHATARCVRRWNEITATARAGVARCNAALIRKGSDHSTPSRWYELLAMVQRDLMTCKETPSRNQAIYLADVLATVSEGRWNDPNDEAALWDRLGELIKRWQDELAH